MRKTLLWFLGCLSVMLVLPMVSLGQSVTPDWAIKMGGLEDDTGHKVAVDPKGNVYVLASIVGSASFDKLEVVVPKPQYKETFLVKYSGKGKALWTKRVGGLAGSVAVDNQGNAFVAGSFRTTFTFESYSFSTHNGFWGAYLVKVSPAGKGLWAKASALTADNAKRTDAMAEAVEVDAGGNAYVLGKYNGIRVFGQDTVKGQPSLFLAKYSGTGEPLWEKEAQGDFSDESLTQGLSVDQAGNVFLAGVFANEARFGDTTITTQALDIDGRKAVFLAKYSPTGEVQWAKAMGRVPYEMQGYAAVKTDFDGNAYVVGSFDEVTFMGSDTVKALGAPVSFLAKYSKLGQIVWARAAANASELSRVTAFTTDGQGKVVLAGEFMGIIESAGKLHSSLSEDSVATFSAFMAWYSASGEPMHFQKLGDANHQQFADVAFHGGYYYLLGNYSRPLQFGKRRLMTTDQEKKHKNREKEPWYEMEASSKDIFLIKYPTNAVPFGRSGKR